MIPTNEQPMRKTLRGVTLERHLVLGQKWEATCQHCGAPISAAEWRWVDIGTEGEMGTFAVGCTPGCAADAAITISEHFADIRAAERNSK
jgi:hypothetical protein